MYVNSRKSRTYDTSGKSVTDEKSGKNGTYLCLGLADGLETLLGKNTFSHLEHHCQQPWTKSYENPKEELHPCCLC